MSQKELHTLGIDIGSTTVKIAVSLKNSRENYLSDWRKGLPKSRNE